MANTSSELLVDSLTGLASKHRFDEYVDIEWRRSLREFYPLTLIHLDVDGFSVLNEQCDESVGDLVLQGIATILQTEIKRAADLVARYDNDDFLILLPGTELDRALGLAERCIQRIAEDPFSPIGDVLTVPITASAGVATIEPSREKNYQELFVEAEEMLTSARQEGGNRASGVEV